MVEAVVFCVRHQEREVFSSAFTLMRFMCSNHPSDLLQEFEAKGAAIKMSTNFFEYPDQAIQETAAEMLILFAKHGFIQEINQQGGQSLLSHILNNFSDQKDGVRNLAIQLFSYLSNDIQIHEKVTQQTKFNFLLSDIQEILDFEQLYPQEQNVLMHVLKIFGEMSKTPEMVEANVSNGIIPMLLRILEEDVKFPKECRIWAFIIINRGCMHAEFAPAFLEKVLKTDPPLFLEFLLYVSSQEDLDFTIHSRLIWQEVERESSVGSKTLLQQFLDNYPLIEKILLSAQRTRGTKSNINKNVVQTIKNMKQKYEGIAKMIKDGAKAIVGEHKEY